MKCYWFCSNYSSRIRARLAVFFFCFFVFLFLFHQHRTWKLLSRYSIRIWPSQHLIRWGGNPNKSGGKKNALALMEMQKVNSSSFLLYSCGCASRKKLWLLSLAELSVKEGKIKDYSPPPAAWYHRTAPLMGPFCLNYSDDEMTHGRGDLCSLCVLSAGMTGRWVVTVVGGGS